MFKPSAYPQVYSYRRFSNIEQEKGSSIARQKMHAENIANEYGLEINQDLVMTDRGFSAFHAEHKRKGALGVFLKLVEEEKIQRGSVLIVESLNRLSREQPFKAQATMNEIIESDITIITAKDNKVYNKEVIAQAPLETLIYSILELIRAHNESLIKQGYSVDFIRQQIKEYYDGNPSDVAGSLVFWLSRKPTQHKKTKGGFELNDKVDVVKYILELYNKGNGVRKISRKLLKKNIPAPLGGDVWGVSTISSILCNPALCGRKVFNLSYLLKGNTKTDPYSLDNYYPAVISEEDFEQMQAKKKRKASAGHGDRGKFVHFLSDYGKRSVCSECDRSVTSQTQTQVNRHRRRLHCAQQKDKEICSSSIIQDYIEDAFLVSVARHIDHNLINQDEDSSAQILVEERLAEIDIALINMMDIRYSVTDPKMRLKLTTDYKRLEAEKEALSKKSGELKKYQVSEDEITEFIARVEAARVFENTEDRRFIKSILELCVRKITVYMQAKPLAEYGYENLYENALVNVIDVEFYSERKLSIFVSSDKDNSTLLFTKIDDEFADDARGSYTSKQLRLWNDHGFEALLEDLGIEQSEHVANSAWLTLDLTQAFAAALVDKIVQDDCSLE
ncbi:recombinase family protein [Vibrio cyclitrophicus]|uniref:recombinase family protein n=1 Tax=Vibrio cyclitrophicus TaxID=47951 RepID=UPI0038B42881